jgi:hypothetical protein
VLVTANKREEDIRKVPASISVIGQEEIENLRVTQLSDLTARVPGLYVQGNGSPGKTQVSLRGVQAAVFRRHGGRVRRPGPARFQRHLPGGELSSRWTCSPTTSNASKSCVARKARCTARVRWVA